jgi:hypothetical protein
MTKKKEPKAALPKLSIDVQAYLNKDLAKDNLKLTREIEKLNKLVTKQEQEIEALKDRDGKDRILGALDTAMNLLDQISDDRPMKKYKKNINKIPNMKFEDVMTLLEDFDYGHGFIYAIEDKLDLVEEILSELEELVEDMEK